MTTTRSTFEVRYAPGDYRWERWGVHRAGFPNAIDGRTLTKRGALRLARRWQRELERGGVSYPA